MSTLSLVSIICQSITYSFNCSVSLIELLRLYLLSHEMFIIIIISFFLRSIMRYVKKDTATEGNAIDYIKYLVMISMDTLDGQAKTVS